MALLWSGCCWWCVGPTAVPQMFSWRLPCLMKSVLGMGGGGTTARGTVTRSPQGCCEACCEDCCECCCDGSAINGCGRPVNVSCCMATGESLSVASLSCVCKSCTEDRLAWRAGGRYLSRERSRLPESGVDGPGWEASPTRSPLKSPWPLPLMILLEKHGSIGDIFCFIRVARKTHVGKAPPLSKMFTSLVAKAVTYPKAAAVIKSPSKKAMPTENDKMVDRCGEMLRASSATTRAGFNITGKVSLRSL